MPSKPPRPPSWIVLGGVVKVRAPALRLPDVQLKLQVRRELESRRWPRTLMRERGRACLMAVVGMAATEMVQTQSFPDVPSMLAGCMKSGGRGVDLDPLLTTTRYASEALTPAFKRAVREWSKYPQIQCGEPGPYEVCAAQDQTIIAVLNSARARTSLIWRLLGASSPASPFTPPF